MKSSFHWAKLYTTQFSLHSAKKKKCPETLISLSVTLFSFSLSLTHSPFQTHTHTHSLFPVTFLSSVSITLPASHLCQHVWYWAVTINRHILGRWFSYFELTVSSLTLMTELNTWFFPLSALRPCNVCAPVFILKSGAPPYEPAFHWRVRQTILAYAVYTRAMTNFFIAHNCTHTMPISF